ncbi:MAG: HD domain-containing protein [Polyangiaceae bacterium]
METELLEMLLALDGVRQSPVHHPEGDALYHSLQVFDLARRETDDRALWAAALLHDVGKSVGSEEHDASGADMLDGLVAPRIVWLVRHHLDLLYAPAVTKRRLSGARAAPGCEVPYPGGQALADLRRLRRWDVGGRSPAARVLSPEQAIFMLFERDIDVLQPGGAAAQTHDHDEEDSVF